MQEGERSRCGEVVVVVVVYGSSSSSNTVDGRNPAPLHSQLEPKFLIVAMLMTRKSNADVSSLGQSSLPACRQGVQLRLHTFIRDLISLRVAP